MSKFMKTRNIIILLGAIFILGVFLYGIIARQEPEEPRIWGNTDVRCLPSGHQDLGVHVHPQVSVFVDGNIEIVPANIGITSDCMAEVHTHDMTGIVHVESVDLMRADDLTLSDLFGVWGKSMEREGYDLAVFLNGERSDDPPSIILRDKDNIEIRYAKK